MSSLLEHVRLTDLTPRQFLTEWGTSVSIGAGVRNVYNGMEDILKSIAAGIDNFVPSGSDSHQILLDQMAVASDVRPAVLDDELYEILRELKSFSHVVSHQYGAALKPDRVIENFEILKQCYAPFLKAIHALEMTLSAADKPVEIQTSIETEAPKKKDTPETPR